MLMVSSALVRMTTSMPFAQSPTPRAVTTSTGAGVMSWSVTVPATAVAPKTLPT
jgi:hypothetical protein